jgi:hypothetical protein
MQVKEITKKSKKTLPPTEMEALVKKMKKESDKLVKGMFEFTDAGGGWIDFSYRFFKDDPLVTMRLVHGEICDIPMGIVKHINNTYKKVRIIGEDNPATSSPIAGRLLPGSKGVPSTYTKTSRIRFIPMDVM